MKYIKKSPSRLHKFVEICRSLALKIGEGLSLDVSTRWSSTYKMLHIGEAYKQAIQTYADADLNNKCHTRVSGAPRPGRGHKITKCAGTKSHTYDE
jgi:hypothetical protein